MVADVLQSVADFFELESGKDAAQVLGWSVLGAAITFSILFLATTIGLIF